MGDKMNGRPCPVCNAASLGTLDVDHPPGTCRPIDNPIVDKDGNTWLWFAPVDGAVLPQWTMVEPVDRARWDAILEGKGAAPDPSDIRGRIEKGK